MARYISRRSGIEAFEFCGNSPEAIRAAELPKWLIGALAAGKIRRRGEQLIIRNGDYFAEVRPLDYIVYVDERRILHCPAELFAVAWKRSEPFKGTR